MIEKVLEFFAKIDWWRLFNTTLMSLLAGGIIWWINRIRSGKKIGTAKIKSGVKKTSSTKPIIFFTILASAIALIIFINPAYLGTFAVAAVVGVIDYIDERKKGSSHAEYAEITERGVWVEGRFYESEKARASFLHGNDLVFIADRKTFILELDDAIKEKCTLRYAEFGIDLNLITDKALREYNRECESEENRI